MRNLLRCPLSVVAVAPVGPRGAQIGQDPDLGALGLANESYPYSAPCVCPQ